jgi:hypothetical protein
VVLAALYLGLVATGLCFWASIQMGWKPPSAPEWDQRAFGGVALSCGFIVLLASLGLSTLLPRVGLPTRLRKVPANMVWLSATMIFVVFADLTPHSTAESSCRRLVRGGSRDPPHADHPPS